MSMVFRFIQYSTLTSVKISQIIINLDFQIKRNSNELFYFEQPSTNHLSKSLSCRQPISNRILASLYLTFFFFFILPIIKCQNQYFEYTLAIKCFNLFSFTYRNHLFYDKNYTVKDIYACHET